ncbi:prepilin-type N-terminal cleavage/methylation domain-containing protein [Yersinia kristensenii]|uniref:prepilin-type N-terminal cleavage/methylation domain-containing protein n=1 Tax=Yersinia kristensenii TaxID=28152 RepID=UPI000519A8A7|nr:peptidase [Yersinia kristensenii]SUP68988.1 prepilin peptidase dependent protein C [Yersinia kristensenii]
MYLVRYSCKSQYTREGGNSHFQQGFSLPEVLIAALFFSVSLLGLLQYHQALLQGFSSLWQQRQAWSLLNQHIESSSGESAKAFPAGMKPNWRYNQFINRIDGECTEFTFILKMHSKQQAELSRWFCIASEGS